MSKTVKEKGRYFAFILYPDSLPEGWKDKLTAIDLPMAISPLHDKDKKEISSEDELTDDELKLYKAGKLYKKPHYHVLYVAKNPVTADGVRLKIKRALGGKTLSHVEIVDGVKSYFDYMTHESKDAVKKKKHKYDKKDITYINDFDIDRYVTLDEHQKQDLFSTLMEIIMQQRLQNYPQLIRFCVKYKVELNLPSLQVINDVISRKVGLIRLGLDGMYQENKCNGTKPNMILNEETNEVKPAEDWTPKGGRAKRDRQAKRSKCYLAHDCHPVDVNGQAIPVIAAVPTFDWETGKILDGEK